MHKEGKGTGINFHCHLRFAKCVYTFMLNPEAILTFHSFERNDTVVELHEYHSQATLSGPTRVVFSAKVLNFRVPPCILIARTNYGTHFIKLQCEFVPE